MKKANLDAGERDIFESVERGEWRSVRGVKQEIHRLQAAAQATLVKHRRINIRMSSKGSGTCTKSHGGSSPPRPFLAELMGET